MLNITNSHDLQKLGNSTLYHGTLLSLAHSILNDRAFLMYKTHKGALGYGAYAFSDYFEGAKSFARYKYDMAQKRAKDQYRSFDSKKNQPCVLSFKLNKLSRVLYWSPQVESNYTSLINGDFVGNFNYKITPTIRCNNNTPNKSLDGAYVDKVINYIESKYKSNINAIMMQRYNIQLPPSKYYIPDTQTPNSTEICLKSNKIIDFNSIKIYNESGHRIG